MILRLGTVILIASGLLASSGCARWHTAPTLPAHNHLVLDQLVLYSDSPLPAHHRLLDELRAQRTHLSAKLALPLSDEPINVYLFASAERLTAFMRVKFPDVPERRAFFVESDNRLSVYAYWGDRVAEDLRHEVAHGYLHSVVPRLPLWLDEGLAEYFEVAPGLEGVNRPHVDQLAAAISDHWRPDLSRLEHMQAAGEMTQQDYAESWAWVHFMLESSPERRKILQTYLQALIHSRSAEPLSAQLRRFPGILEQQLGDYVLAVHHGLR